MRQQTTKPFPYFVGIHSLEELVTKQSRVCVINILGSESRDVTPISHEYSGGNVIAGVQYGRRGELETRLGAIPVYPSVRDVMKQGHTFDIGVIYLPPMAVSQAVWELTLYNKDLKRIIIISEKVSARDSRNVRFICQDGGVDVIGANCLGIANVWDHVRVGGALGGDVPEETLKKGTIAIHSNSGNFTTTIAEYLRTEGFGISTAVSSGKDVYIHFALPEFLYAAQNDTRTKAVALYVEPGGYYEKQALDWIKSRVFGFNKPIVVCVTGRWKKDILRSCGHAGAMAGSGDDAESKEKWFDDYFGMGVFDPKKPKVCKKGIRVASIQQIPHAMSEVYKMIGEEPDFKSSGDLALKPWIGDNFIQLPKELDIPTVKAIPPYDEHITEMNKEVGAHYLHQNMRNKSGASRMDPKTQISDLHGIPILELSKFTVEENVFFTLAKTRPDTEDLPIINFLLNLFLKVDESQMTAIDNAKANECTPNAFIASQIATIGNHPFLEKISQHSKQIIDTIREYGTHKEWDEIPKSVEKQIIKDFLKHQSSSKTECYPMLFEFIQKSPKNVSPMKFCQYLIRLAEKRGLFIRDEYEFLLAALTVSLMWKSMMEKRISREVVEDGSTYFYILSHFVAFSVIHWEKNTYWQHLVSNENINLEGSFTENIFKILFNRRPVSTELTELKYLLGLTITNGPGTISTKGAKDSVSAGNRISMAFVGFLTNTGLWHGGNGFEAVEYLLEQFQDTALSDPGKKDMPLPLKKMAKSAAKKYARYKELEKETGTFNYKRIPCIGHPVFKGNAVNSDPREEFVRKEMEAKGIYNVFLEFYHILVQELFNEGATGTVFCVNVDAVLAVITLKFIWSDFKKKKISLKDIQDLVFILFLLGRAIGVAADIADHRDRGLPMDCRTPQKEVGFVL
jgi:succinyl-CoA synthetase alpha subunit/citrate synthase